jgi:hypothetical protein
MGEMNGTPAIWPSFCLREQRNSISDGKIGGVTHANNPEAAPPHLQMAPVSRTVSAAAESCSSLQTPGFYLLRFIQFFGSANPSSQAVLVPLRPSSSVHRKQA